MAPRGLSLLASVSLLLLTFAGCESTALPKPTGTSTITLEESTRRGVLTTKLGTEIVFELPRPKRENYLWRLVQNDTRWLVPLGDMTAPTPDTGRSVVHFLAIRAGRSQLKFAALPPNITEAAPGDTYDIVVTIQPP